jgi:hypothetical protein
LKKLDGLLDFTFVILRDGAMLDVLFCAAAQLGDIREKWLRNAHNGLLLFQLASSDMQGNGVTNHQSAS